MGEAIRQAVYSQDGYKRAVERAEKAEAELATLRAEVGDRGDIAQHFVRVVDERQEARALVDEAIQKLTWMDLTGVASELAKKRTWR